jgi:hypothetical protein
LKIQIGDGLSYRVPIHFLRIVDLVTPGNAGAMEMRDVLDVVANGADQIAFHDLHVIRVVEQLHTR